MLLQALGPAPNPRGPFWGHHCPACTTRRPARPCMAPHWGNREIPRREGPLALSRAPLGPLGPLGLGSLGSPNPSVFPETRPRHTSPSTIPLQRGRGHCKSPSPPMGLKEPELVPMGLKGPEPARGPHEIPLGPILPQGAPGEPLNPWEPWAASHGRPVGPWAPWAASHGKSCR